MDQWRLRWTQRPATKWQAGQFDQNAEVGDNARVSERMLNLVPKKHRSYLNRLKPDKQWYSVLQKPWHAPL